MRAPHRGPAQPFWRRRLLPVVLVLAGLNALIFLGLTLPRALRERRAAQRIVAVRAELSQDRQLLAARERLAETLRLNEQDNTRFFQSIVGDRAARLVPTLQEIEKAAQEQGLEVGPSNYDPQPVKGLALERYTVSMPVSGSYGQLLGFLRLLERSRQFLTVDSVALSGGQGEAQARQEADLRVALSAYFLLEENGGRER